MKLLIGIVLLIVMITKLECAMGEEKECVSPCGITHLSYMPDMDSLKNNRNLEEENDYRDITRFCDEATATINIYKALCTQRELVSSYIDDERIDLFFKKAEKLKLLNFEEKKLWICMKRRSKVQLLTIVFRVLKRLC